MEGSKVCFFVIPNSCLNFRGIIHPICLLEPNNLFLHFQREVKFSTGGIADHFANLNVLNGDTG
jgi:hypothetical protein